MTEEIKEMLHCIEMNCKHNKCFGGIKLDEKDCKLLLDYITNLQQENERLKETVENLTTMTVCGDKKQIKNTAQYKLDIYKSRCEKAVEYIKEHIKYECDDNFNGMSFYSYHLYDFKKEDLLNILNGSDENE